MNSGEVYSLHPVLEYQNKTKTIKINSDTLHQNSLWYFSHGRLASQDQNLNIKFRRKYFRVHIRSPKYNFQNGLINFQAPTLTLAVDRTSQGKVQRNENKKIAPSAPHSQAKKFMYMQV
jgi:hypothetical protein